jgi:copper(I)-binding protein
MKHAASLLLLLLPFAAGAADPGIQITDAWSRATAGTAAPGVAYLTITDTGAADTLLGVTTPVAGSAMLHKSSETGGIMRMDMVDSLPITAGATVRFEPGGYHIMLMGLTHALKPDETFPLTLEFAHAGKQTVTVTVRKLGDAPKDDGMGGMDMDHHHD